MYRNIRRVADLVLKTRSKYSRAVENGSCVTHGQNVSQYRSYLLLRHYQGQHAAKTAYKKMEFPFRSSGLYRNYSTMYAGNTARFHAQTAWKRINQMYSYNSSSVPTIGRIAQAFSLASTRSHLIVPGVLAFLFGELALADKTHAESYLSSRNSACMHPEYSNLFFSTLVSFAAESLILLFRALYLSVLFLPSLITAPFADSFGPEFRKLWLQLVHHTLEKAGPAFIKWGQWAATRPDLFPRDLCIELAKLQSSAPEHSFEYTKKSIEGAFGRKISEIFESFEENPIASGSIAQVHRAVLRYRYPDQKIKPMDVAVKVRHPGVGESIRRDFAIINTIAKISKFIPPLNWLRLDESVQQFAVFMMSQVDLAREAAHLNRFIYNFRRWKDVSFPKPVYPLVHPAVLVESYEQGESVAHYVEDIEGQPCVKAALAHIGTNALLKMLLVDNFVHADLHPGNILVRVAPSKSPKKKFSKSKPHVVFLDVGMTAELSKGDQTNVVEFFKAVARRDGRTAAECTLRLSKNQNCPNPEAFIKEVEQSFSFWGTAEGDVVHPAECMQNLLEQVRRHRVNIDGNVCTVMVTTLVLEGWQRKLDPDYDVMSTLQKLLGKADWAESLSYTMEQLV